MDDFLHNLRSGKLKQQDRGGRNYSDYKGPQRRAGNERRRPDYYTKVTNENFAMVKESLNSLTEAQKRVGDALLAVDKTGSRIADALESLVEIMSGQSDNEKAQPLITETADALSTDEPLSQTIQDEDTTNRQVISSDKTKLSDEDKPKMIGIISTMRSEKISWEKIAQHIDDLNIPTVSGKGRWRGQAIKKFYDANS